MKLIRNIGPTLLCAILCVSIFMLTISYLVFNDLYMYRIEVMPINDYGAYKEYRENLKTLEDLRKSGLVVSPHEFTERISGFYNTIIVILIFILSLFTFFGIFHLKFLAKEQVQEEVINALLKDKIVDSTLKKSIAGIVDERVSEAVSDYFSNKHSNRSEMDQDRDNDSDGEDESVR